MIRDWNSYHGTHQFTKEDGQDCVRWHPQWSGHSRHVTPQTFVPPLVVAGWVKIEEEHGEGPYEGIHIHFGHVGNARNYVASLVRRDGHMVLSREGGWREYDDFARNSRGAQFVPQRTYMVRVEWHRLHIVATVADEVETHTLIGEITNLAQTGPSKGKHSMVIEAGSVGVRLDGITAAGALAVRELPQ